MTTERDPDLEPTVEIQRPVPPRSDTDDDENFDPEKTLVREDDESFGWESAGLRRLSREVQNRSDL
jgi:hypothetical protein